MKHKCYKASGFPSFVRGNAMLLYTVKAGTFLSQADCKFEINDSV